MGISFNMFLINNEKMIKAMSNTKNFEIVTVNIDDQLPWTKEIYNNEIGFGGGGITRTMVGTINDNLKQIRPCHGYFAPHPTGKKLQKYAKKLGYEYKG